MSTIAWPTYKLAKELARILTPLTGQIAHSVKNSRTFVERIRDISVSHRDLMVSFKATSLFTQVLIDQALNVVEERLIADQSLEDRATIHVSQLIQPTHLCLQSTYFQF